MVILLPLLPKYWHPRHVSLLPPLRLHSYEGLAGDKHIWNVDRKFRTTPESSNPFNSEMPIEGETIILQQRYQETCVARSGVSISTIWELLIKYRAPGWHVIQLVGHLPSAQNLSTGVGWRNEFEIILRYIWSVRPG